MADPVNFIDNSPMARIFTAILEEGPAFIGKALSKGAGILGAVTASAGSVFGTVKETVMGASHSAPSMHASETSIGRGREVEAPAVAVAKASAYECNMNDVVCPVTPKINSSSIGRSA